MEIEWHMLHPGYYLRSFVDGSVFCFFFLYYSGRCVPFRKYSTGSGISRKRSRVQMELKNAVSVASLHGWR